MEPLFNILPGIPPTLPFIYNIPPDISSFYNTHNSTSSSRFQDKKTLTTSPLTIAKAICDSAELTKAMDDDMKTFTKNVSRVFRELKETGQLLDLELITSDEKSYHVHKNYVKAFSDFFDTMFSGNTEMTESQTGVVHLAMISSEGLEPILEQMYSDPLEWRTGQHVNGDNALEVYKAANFLMMRTSIKHQSKKILLDHITARNVIEIMENACMLGLHDIFTSTELKLVEYLHTTIKMYSGSIQPAIDDSTFTPEELREIDMWTYLPKVRSCMSIEPPMLLRGLVRIGALSNGNVMLKEDMITWVLIDPHDIEDLKKRESYANTRLCEFLGHMKNKVVEYNNHDIYQRVVMHVRDKKIEFKGHFTTVAVVNRCSQSPKGEVFHVTFQSNCGYSRHMGPQSRIPFSHNEPMEFIAVKGFLFSLSKSGKYCQVLDRMDKDKWCRVSSPTRAISYHICNMVTLGTKVFVVGHTAHDDRNNKTVSSSSSSCRRKNHLHLHEFCFERKEWSIICRIPPIISGAKMVVWNGKIYILGASNQDLEDDSEEEEKEDGEQEEEGNNNNTICSKCESNNNMDSDNERYTDNKCSQMGGENTYTLSKSNVIYDGFIEIDPKTTSLKRLEACPVDVAELLSDDITTFVAGNIFYVKPNFTYNFQQGKWAVNDNMFIRRLLMNANFISTMINSSNKEVVVVVERSKLYGGLWLYTYSVKNGTLVENSGDNKICKNSIHLSDQSTRFYPIQLPIYPRKWCTDEEPWYH